MTNYDPYAYGEVRLDPNKQRAPLPQEDDDDPLYGTASRPVIDTEQELEQPPVDASWALLGEDVQDLLPGADVEAAPKPDAPKQPAPQKVATAPAPAASIPGAVGPQRVIERQPLAPLVADEAPRAPEPRRRAAGLPRRPSPLVAAVLPALLCSGGAGAGWWFWVTQENPVMAVIFGAATLVSALFAWLLLRG
jgi:hypothetical protein